MVNADFDKVGGLKEAYDMDEKINNQGGGFFSALKDDGDKAIIRFLYKDDKDVDFAWVHRVSIQDKQRYVKCHGKGCHLCQEVGKPKLRLFLQVLHDDEVKMWERGKTFIPKFINIAERYAPIYKQEFEVVRNGKKGDTKTNYELFKLDGGDPVDEDILEKKQTIIDGKNGFVLDLSKSEMEEVAAGTFELKKEEGNSGGGAGQGQKQERRREPVGEEEVF